MADDLLTKLKHLNEEDKLRMIDVVYSGTFRAVLNSHISDLKEALHKMDPLSPSFMLQYISIQEHLKAYLIIIEAFDYLLDELTEKDEPKPKLVQEI